MTPPAPRLFAFAGSLCETSCNRRLIRGGRAAQALAHPSDPVQVSA